MTKSASKPAFHPIHTDWNLVRCFIAVVEHGSLTKAAAQLGLSQPTLSRQISELEQVIGAALFERVSRGLKLTTAGTQLVEPARHMMTAARMLSTAAAVQDQTLKGTVRLTASEIVSAHVLPGILKKMVSAYPEIQVELVASNQLSNLLEREADIAIRMVRPTQTSLIARHIADWAIGFYAHQSYIDHIRQHSKFDMPETISNLEQLAQLRWIGMDQSDLFINGFRGAGIQIEDSFFAFRCDNHLVNWQALAAGLGIGIANCWMAEQNASLVRVFSQQALPSLPVWLTAHRELNANKKIRVVFDFLVAALNEVR